MREPSGEGAVDCNVVVYVDNIGNDGIGSGGGHFVEISKFWSDFGAGNDFLGADLVESIDKGLIFGLGNSTNR